MPFDWSKFCHVCSTGAVLLTVSAFGQGSTGNTTSATEQKQQQQQQTPTSSTSGMQIQQQLASVKVASRVCTSLTPCYTPHTYADVLHAQSGLHQVLSKYAYDYALSTDLIRRELEVPLPDELSRGAIGHLVPIPSGTSRSYGFVETSYGQNSPSTFTQFAMRMSSRLPFLASSLNALGMSGLSDYVQSTSRTIEMDKATNTVASAQHALRSTDAMYVKLQQAKSNLSISPRIASVPTGATIIIATRVQAALGRSEFYGSTDTVGTYLYRGIYLYTISAPGFVTFAGEMDLITTKAT